MVMHGKLHHHQLMHDSHRKGEKESQPPPRAHKTKPATSNSQDGKPFSLCFFENFHGILFQDDSHYFVYKSLGPEI